MEKIKWILALVLAAGVGAYGERLVQENLERESSGAKLREATKAVEAAPSSTAYGTVQAPPGGFDKRFVRSAEVVPELVPQTIFVPGKLAFDSERTHLASARVSGRLDRILVFEGARVMAGQPLAELYSPDYIAAENEYLLARSTVATLKGKVGSELLADAMATEQSARQKLLVLGASPGDLDRLDRSGAAASHLTIRAPISGVVVKRNMDPGAFLNVGDTLMTIVDPSTLWFQGSVYEQSYGVVRIGQTLTLTAMGLPGRVFAGRLSYIAPSIDPDTRTLPVRCDIPNPDGRLRPEMFVTASLQVGRQQAVVVPKLALLRIRDGDYVILDLGKGVYRRQRVTAEPLADGRVALLNNVGPGSRVVVEGAALVNGLFGNSEG